jgi:serine/threonine protein kinase/Tol biopolymer transport system component
METKRWRQVDSLLQSVLECRPEEREEFLRNACDGDLTLEQEVRSLLSAHQHAGSFLESPAFKADEQLIDLNEDREETQESIHSLVGQAVSHYRILRKLGGGGMGEVYRAHDSVLKRDVAIKILPTSVAQDPDRLLRFEQEAQAAAALNHPNILAVHEFGTFEGVTYLVSELLEGNTLRELLQRGPAPVRKAIDYGVQIVRGLAAAHVKGIVHRDLKPENLFVGKDGHVKILDFGLARLTHREPEAHGALRPLVYDTDLGMVVGTPGYMAPEQVRGRPADHRTDIFAFGATLYEMLSGKRAFQRETSAETMTAILNDEPPSISQVAPSAPPGLQRVVQRCLEKNPDQRFQTSSDLAFALEALSDSGIVPVSTSDRAAISHRTWLAMCIVGALVAAVLAYLWWRIPPAIPVVESITQLTNDSEPKDWFAPIGTDGARVYFTEKYEGNFRLAQVAASGGPVAPVPTQIPGAYQATIAPDFSGLLVMENPFGHHPVWFQPLPAGDPVRVGNLEAQGAAFTPDGKQIVYSDGNTINIADPDGANVHKVADLPGGGYCPSVSPDGKKVRVTVAAEGTAWLWEVQLDGSGMRRLTFEGKDLSGPACGRWSLDGRYFIFQTGVVGYSEIWAISERRGFLHKENRFPTRLTNGALSCNLPTPSVDGKQVFARCDKQRGELVRYDRKLNQFISFLGGISAIEVEFSRDGAWVVYVSYPDQSLWRMRADGREKVLLTYPKAGAFSPRISPDGTQVVFGQAEWGSKPDLYMVRMEERTPHKIEGTTAAFDPCWSPDGRFLAFDVTLPDLPPEQNSSEIHVLDLKSGKISMIPHSRGKSSPSWVAQDTLVATADDGSKVLRYEFETQAWSDLAAGPYSGCTSMDDVYVYCTTMDPARPAAVRIRVADGQVDSLADLSGLNPIVENDRELYLTPKGELLFTRDIGTQEIYALNIRWP